MKKVKYEIPNYKVCFTRKEKLWSVILDGKIHYIQTKYVGKKKMYYHQTRYHTTLRNCIFAILLGID